MNAPSITKQTKWNLGFFDFGKAESIGVRYFNPALINKNGSDWLIARKAVSVPYNNIGHNSLVAFKLDDNHKPIAFVDIDLRNKAYLDQNFEDPRIIDFNGNALISYCTFQVNNRTYTGAHQQVAILGENWQPTSIWDPIYKGNGGSIMTNSGNEKNWIFFEHESDLHSIYMTDPHEVVRWKGTDVDEVFETKGIEWDFGHIRGGSNPVLLGDEYLSFFHSSIKWGEKSRRYFMGAYSFKAKPPFKISKMTPKPLLIGSEEDPQFNGLPLVVFPCGAIKSGNNFVVSLGVNDCKSAWIEIPCNELSSLLKNV